MIERKVNSISDWHFHIWRPSPLQSYEIKVPAHEQKGKHAAGIKQNDFVLNTRLPQNQNGEEISTQITKNKNFSRFRVTNVHMLWEPKKEQRPTTWIMDGQNQGCSKNEVTIQSCWNICFTELAWMHRNCNVTQGQLQLAYPRAPRQIRNKDKKSCVKFS